MAIDAPSPHLDNQRGQANISVALALIILLVGGIWIWNHLDFDTQDFIVDEVVPILFLVVALTLITWVNVRKIKRAKHKKTRRDKLLKQFSNEKAPRKRFDLASQLIELNEFQLEGLESVATDMAEVFLYTFKRSLGDKQHRFRGMAASYLGVVQHRESIPLLIKALEDDHAYVRSSAALALGRMRATEAKAKLEYTMKEDWDQTVRSRSREAVERMS
ncbi:MAG: HEAT repeat domain-containing protein [Nitrospira sp. SB0672_bin_25]|nr:HEAT repeat domain-containing protein [Nitrospira sp. SB0678_bin_10]MYJ54242.1 HEAT repeat domain-containing protein [Nitrospira sp. SB0672_bin_25]